VCSATPCAGCQICFGDLVEDMPDFSPLAVMDDLKAHPAVLAHGQGVDSVDLANFQAKLAELGQQRFMTVGNRDYGGERQKFETMTIDALVEGFLEEAADAINYMAMASIKFLAGVKFLDASLENACAE